MSRAQRHLGKSYNNSVVRNHALGGVMTNPAEELKDIMSGISTAMSAMGHLMAQNDELEKVLISYLRYKNIPLEGFSIRHYDRNGNLEFKLRAHSVARGFNPEMLYHKSRAELLAWKASQASGPSLNDLRNAVRPIIQFNK